MSRRPQSVVSLDPIDRNNRRRSGVVGRFLKTKRFRGKGMAKTDNFGHYLFVGKQRSGKTVSAIWYYEFLKKKYEMNDKSLIICLGGVLRKKSSMLSSERRAA